MPPPSRHQPDPLRQQLIGEGTIPMRHVLTSLLIVVTMSGAALAVEVDTDRPGLDYRSFDIDQTNPGPCESACTAEARCRAWTYVKPGVQGPRARCWLKSAVPQATVNACCISGVSGDDPETAEAREIQSLLATLGYDPGPVDGKPGRQTRDAIRRFQAEHQMTADGRISPLLVKGLWAVATTRDWAAPAEAPDAGRAAAPPPPAAEPARPAAPVAPAAPAAPAEDLSGLSTLD
jgi:hypothetical protein